MQHVEADAAPTARHSAFSLLQYGPVAIAFAFLVLHLPFLPASLEDVDSINFALGVRRFDVAAHQPHPPGYPLFIALGKIVHLAGVRDAAALALVGIVAGACAVFALAALYRRVDERAPSWLPLAATLVAVTAPLFWFTADRPLSDMTGLTAALAVQAGTLAAASTGAFAGAAFAAAFATGIRSQIAWLSVPLLAYAIVCRPRGTRGRTAAIAVAALIVGGLVWFVPLVILSGGPAAYWRTLFNQGAEDLSGVVMLATTPTPRELLAALRSAFVAPWAIWPVATIVLLLAAIGTAALRRTPRALVIIAVAFVPYLAFDLLFQETVTTRYALPLVVPVAYLAVRGALTLGPRAAVAVAIVLAVFDAHVGGTSIAAYARAKAPAFRMVDDVAAAARQLKGSIDPVVGMHFDFRRPFTWAEVDGRLPATLRRLPGPPKHEWLALVDYWNHGGRMPIWFAADPIRTDLALIDPGARHTVRAYPWALPYPVLIGGVRPNLARLERIDPPGWYLGEGWAVTPETAGVAFADRRGPEYGPIEGRVRRDVLETGALVVGGRNFDPVARPRVTVSAGDFVLDEFTVAPGFFLSMKPIYLPHLDPALPDYSRLTVRVSPPTRVAIEQFDAAPLFGPPGDARRPLVGYGEGWNEAEYEPATGLRWRWLSERGQLRTIDWGLKTTLHVEGESPLRYFKRPSHLVIRDGDAVLIDRELSSDFSLDVPVPAASTPVRTIVFETDQFYVPADRTFRSRDRRHLGLRIFTCELRPAS